MIWLVWAGTSVVVGIAVGRWLRGVDPGDHDIWGCDTCEQEAAEIAAEEAQAESKMRHPSNRKARELAELESWWAAS